MSRPAWILLTSIAPILAMLEVNAQSWVQQGADIDGMGPNEHAGISISMPDSATVGLGLLPSENDPEFGRVRVYAWDGSAWTQKGSDILGEMQGDRFGIELSMPDANTVAVGAPDNEGNGLWAGNVRIFDWEGNAWTQRGADLDGAGPGDHAGSAISMPDANTVAIGSFGSDANGLESGQTQVFTWNGSSWIQKGQAINGEVASEHSGSALSMPDANTVAIGAPDNDANGAGAGQVRVYSWSGSAWIQKGVDLDGEAMFERAGYDVSMPDANTLAIGAPKSNLGPGISQVRVYSWNGAGWVLKGAAITGFSIEDRFGASVCMPDANTVAAGAPYADEAGNASGQVAVYNWNGVAWVPLGAGVVGEGTGDVFGWCVSMPTPDMLAVGAYWNDGFATDAGHARVFRFDIHSEIEEGEMGHGFQVYPNPTHGTCTIELDGWPGSMTVIVKNALGQEVLRREHVRGERIELHVPGMSGLYTVEVNDQPHGRAVGRIIKNEE